MLVWLVIGIVVVFVVYRGRRANDLALAGIAMGEAVEHAVEERVLAHDQLPPPDIER